MNQIKTFIIIILTYLVLAIFIINCAQYPVATTNTLDAGILDSGLVRTVHPYEAGTVVPDIKDKDAGNFSDSGSKDSGFEFYDSGVPQGPQEDAGFENDAGASDSGQRETSSCYNLCHTTPSGNQIDKCLPEQAFQSHLQNHSNDFEGICN